MTYAAINPIPNPIWQNAWREIVGPDTVIRTSPRWDGMVKHLGYSSIDLPSGINSLLSAGIPTDKDLVLESQEALRKTKIIPTTQLKEIFLVHLELAKALARQFDPKIKVYAAIIPPASDKTRTAGLYDMETGEIMLSLETLELGRTTVDAMIHELGHHVAFIRTKDPVKAEDLQPAHSDAMTYVATMVFHLAADGIFDTHLKEVVW